ncbi:glutathione peroxidase [Pontibacter sp. XAAS-A31]|nr:glutathione peroxidase [Pontibacter harenae]MCC9167151.1 glutathione peroxidase [Pontibacter harenae]
MKTSTFLLQAAVLLALVAMASFTAPKADSKATTLDTMENEAAVAKGFYSFKMQSLEGKKVDFSKYKGKKVLLVNTASECGYTPQYADLQKLHETHGDKVVVLGFPANNFGGQEPGSTEEIASFCQKNYGVTFQMFDKVSVLGEDQHPLYSWLQQQAPNKEKPSWNFCKYLVDENGKVVAFFPSKVKPMSEELLAAINK